MLWTSCSGLASSEPFSGSALVEGTPHLKPHLWYSACMRSVLTKSADSALKLQLSSSTLHNVVYAYLRRIFI